MKSLKKSSLLMEPFPVCDLVETLCFPSQKCFAHFTNGKEMFRQCQQGLTVSVAVNTCLQRAKVGISEFAKFYGLILLPGTWMVRTVLLGYVEWVSGKVSNWGAGSCILVGSFLPMVPRKALCPNSSHRGTCHSCPWMYLCLPPSTEHLVSAVTQAYVRVKGGRVTRSMA